MNFHDLRVVSSVKLISYELSHYFFFNQFFKNIFFLIKRCTLSINNIISPNRYILILIKY